VTETLEDKLAKIEHAADPIPRLCERCLQSAGGVAFISHLFIIGVANRTLALSSGFRTHIAARNFTCAAALLRMQVDTALRVYAAWLVPDAMEYAYAVFRGDKVDEIKDRDGKRLTDRYLVERLSEHHSCAWVKPVYTETCNFIHFTSRHIFASLGKLNDDDLYFQVSVEDPPRADSEYFEVVDAFFESMNLTVALARGFARKRAKNPPPPEGPNIKPVR
jgi:hypothetical protein